MKSIIVVNSEKEWNELNKHFSVTGLDNTVMARYGSRIKLIKPCKKIAERVLDDSTDDSKLIIDALFDNKLFGPDYEDYGIYIVTDKDLASIETISNVFAGDIEGKTLTSPKYLIKDFSCFKYFTNIRSLDPIGEDGYCGLFAAQYLETICLPKSIKELSQSAFAFCMNLQNVDLNAVETIKTKSFYYCINLYSLTIPASVKVIEANAFAKSAKLKTIIMKSSTPCKVYKDTFAGISEDFIIKVPRGSLDAYREAWKYVDPSKFIVK